MAQLESGRLRIFISHSHEDISFARLLVSALMAAGADVWFDESTLSAGSAWYREIEREISTRPVFILIVSSASQASTWVQNETALAMKLQSRDRNRVLLPIVLEPIRMHGFLSIYQFIDGYSIPTAEVIEETLAALKLGTKAPSNAVQAATQQEQAESEENEVGHLISEGNTFREKLKYNEALDYYEQATEIAPTVALPWALKGAVLADLQRPEQSIAAFDQALQLSPESTQLWQSKAEILRTLRRYNEVVSACDHALALDPGQVGMWTLKGHSLWILGRFAEAGQAYGRALDLEPTSLGDMAKSIRSVIRRITGVSSVADGAKGQAARSS